MIRIFNNKPEQVLSFSREKDGDRVVVAINLSSQPVDVILDSKNEMGKYTELFSDKKYELKGNDEFRLGPWNYIVLAKN